jgi:Flp pilus assembly protein TadG
MMRHRLLNASCFFRDVRGAAAAEFVLMLPLLIAPIIPMVDVGVFAVQRMQVEAASRAGAGAAWHVCDDATKAATQTNCTGGVGDLSAAITAAVQSTTLADGVTLESEPVAGYYCADSAGALTPIGGAPWLISSTTPNAKPTDCSAVITGSTTAPAQYIQVAVTFTYTPVFGVLRDAGILPATIARTAWWRIS